MAGSFEVLSTADVLKATTNKARALQRSATQTLRDSLRDMPLSPKKAERPRTGRRGSIAMARQFTKSAIAQISGNLQKKKADRRDVQAAAPIFAPTPHP